MLGVSDEHLLDEMRVRLEDGAVFGGASAVMAIARHIWWAWPLWALSRLPGAMPLLNAGAALFIAGEVGSVKQGLARAATAIDSGDAKRVLARVVSLSHVEETGEGVSAL